ncbi:Zinc finger C2H2 [Penicillium alfredii]|uniref:Zinc finger C2H2 n=1 Tax=Penicillium alfredii TaxID=1506179 RepID=A0A9W9F338_9EURO|nr:Zinc finger C2H2 [Penicillium alfredii]KAJ5092644.1 Zinc finger C2H2 [Penicillium alfredii]
MGTALDALASQPLNTRRPAAPTLPSFELPPPPFTLPGTAPKYSPANHPPVSHPPVNVSVGNLLTPPATNQPGESATASTGVSADLPPAYWSGTYGDLGIRGPSGLSCAEFLLSLIGPTKSCLGDGAACDGRSAATL